MVKLNSNGQEFNVVHLYTKTNKTKMRKVAEIKTKDINFRIYDFIHGVKDVQKRKVR